MPLKTVGRMIKLLDDCFVNVLLHIVFILDTLSSSTMDNDSRLVSLPVTIEFRLCSKHACKQSMSD